MTDHVFDAEGVEVINTAQSVFPNAVVKSTRGKQKPKPCIIIDTREQAPLTPHFDGAVVDTEVVGLSEGDYSLRGATDLIRIERKSLADLTSCCGKDRERFMDQMGRLASYQHKFLIIERLEEEIWAQAYRSQIKPQSVIATLNAIMVKHGVCVVFANGVKDAARKVQWWCTYVFERQQRGMYNVDSQSSATGT